MMFVLFAFFLDFYVIIAILRYFLSFLEVEVEVNFFSVIA